MKPGRRSRSGALVSTSLPSLRALGTMSIACRPAQRPRIFIYPSAVGFPPFQAVYDQRLDFLAQRIRASPHYTTDGSCADFFLLHNYVGARTSSTWVAEMFSKVATSYEFWNRTWHSGPVRHFIISPCDHGPGDCMYDRNLHPGPDTAALSLAVPWDALDPSSDRRRVGFLTLNGALSPHNHFKRGIDIRLPAFDGHQCGPYCGMPHPQDSVNLARAQRVLRRYSPWKSVGSGNQVWPLLRSRRRFRLFWAGRATRGGARGDLFRYHMHRRGFLLHDTSGKFPSTTVANASHPDFFARGMRSSDFCLSPLGQSDGDSDRYLPALLYGCVPVFSSAREARPFEEILPWDRFSLTLSNGARDVALLHLVLRNISDSQLHAMRTAMSVAWQRVLWTSVHVERGRARTHARLDASKDLQRSNIAQASSFSYLGEPPYQDAFSALMKVFRHRLQMAAPGR